MSILDKVITTLTGRKETINTLIKTPLNSCGMCGIKIRSNSKHTITVKGTTYHLCDCCAKDINENPTLIYWFNPIICSSCGIATKVVYLYGTERAYSYKSLVVVTKGGKDYHLCADCFSYYQKMREKRNSYHRSSALYIKVDGLIDRFLVSGLIEGMSNGITVNDLKRFSIN